MTENPYKPPAAVVSDGPPVAADAIKLYSPNQVFGGTLLGGPVALIYFLWKNFSALGDDSGAAKTMAWGAALIVAFIVVLPLLPESFPGAPITFAVAFGAKALCEKLQKKKQEIADSPQYDFQATGSVWGYGLLCAIGTIIAIGGPLFLLIMLDIWNP
jgi:hypothetical protein